MEKILYILAALLLFVGAKAQEIDVIFNNGQINRIDLSNNCTQTTLESITLPGNGAAYSDITYDQRGQIYLVDERNLFRLEGNQPVLVREIYEEDNPFRITGLTALTDTIVIASTDDNAPLQSGELIYFIVSTGELITVSGAGFPGSAGDITPFEGGFYMAATSNRLVKMDKLGNLDPTFNFNYPGDIGQVFGITSSFADCQNPSTFNTAFDGSSNTTNILQVDLITNEINQVCAINGQINGSTTLNEFSGGVCQISFDLDVDNSTAPDNDYAGQACADVSAAIVDNDLSIASDTTLASFRIFIESGNITFDLSGIPANFTATETDFLLIEPAAGSTPNISEFMQVLLAIQVDANEAGSSEILIQLENAVGQTTEATARLVFLPVIDEGADSTIAICNNTPPFLLDSILPAGLSELGVWQPARFNNSPFDPSVASLDSNIVRFIVESNACGSAEYRFNLMLEADLPTNFLPQDTFICLDESYIIEADANVSQYSFFWSDSSTNSVLEVADAGIYSLTISSGNCTQTDSIQLINEDCLNCNVDFPNIINANRSANFFMATTCEVLDFEAMVFDRWGNKVSESNDPNNIWDGRFNNGNEQLPVGTYTFFVRFKVGEQMTEVIRSGDVTLVY